MKNGVRVLDLWIDTSSGPKWPKYKFYTPHPKVSCFWDFIILLDSSYNSWENEVFFVKVEAKVLDFWLDMSSGINKWPKCTFYVPDPKVKKFFQISWFYWIYFIIHEKIKSCFWKLKLGFWIYGLISPLAKALGPNCPKLALRPQTTSVTALESRNLFVSSLYFQILGYFFTVMSVYHQKITKSHSKILFLVPFQICKFPLSLL